MTRILILLAAFTGLLQAQLVKGNRVIEGTVNYCADTGVSDDYSCTFSPTITTYITGACYAFKANTANTGASKVNFGPGLKTIKKAAGGVTTDLSDNDIRAGQLVGVCYDGTNMQMQSASGNTSSGGVTASTSYLLVTHRSHNNASSLQQTGSANSGNCSLFHVPYTASWTKVAFKVTTISGTSCTGGTCGFQVGVYTYGATRNLIAASEVGTSGNATSTKDINTLNWKQLNWASGSSVSGGVLSLNAGSYLHCITTDSTALWVGMINQPGYLTSDNEVSTAAYGYNAHGYQSAMSTGNGASIALKGSLSGTMTQSGSGDAHPVLYFIP